MEIIRKIREKSRRNFAVKLSRSISWLILVSFLVAFSFSNIIFARFYYNHTIRNDQVVTRNLAGFIDDYANSTINLCTLPFYTQQMQDTLKGMGIQPFKGEKVIAMENIPLFSDYLGQIHNSSVRLDEMYIFCSMDNRLLYYSGLIGDPSILSLIEDEKYKETIWYQKADAARGLVEFLSSNEMFREESPEICYLTKQIRDLSTGKEIATVLFSINTEKVVSGFRDFLSGPNDQILIVDEDDTVRYSTDKNKAEYSNLLSSLETGGNESSFWEFLYSGYIVSQAVSENMHWRIICLFPYEAARASLIEASSLVLILFIAITVSTLIISKGISRHLTKPISLLSSGMQKAEEGDLTQQIPVLYNDQLGDLTVSFNKMMIRLNELIQSTYILELEKTRAQMLALQNMINPHFLYNTLNSIQMTAILNKDYKVSRMLSKLGEILHYVLSANISDVTLGDEISMIEVYCELFTIQNDNPIELTVNVSDRMKEFRCVKMCLQPIVENAFVHGYLSNIPHPRIMIDAEETEDGYIVRVWNNGHPIEMADLDKIKAHMNGYDETDKKDHIGLKNVFTRIRTMNPDNELLIENKDDGVLISILFRREG